MRKNKIKKVFNKNILFGVIFLITLVVSLFSIVNTFAQTTILKITKVEVSDKSEGVISEITSVDNDDIVNIVEFHKLNDYITYEITFKNIDSKKYTIKTITDDNDNPYVEYEYDKHENEEINPDEEKVITIKAIYKNEVTNMDKRNVNNSVKFLFSFIDENGEESGDAIIINPQTKDNIYVYIALAIISVFGLLFIGLKRRKKVLLVGLLLLPIFVKALTFNFEMSLTNTIKLYDKVLVTKIVNGEVVEEIVSYGSKTEKPDDPIKDGYNFIGWYKGNEPYTFGSNLTGDIELEAKYEIIEYDINYILNDGAVDGNPTKYTVEDEITLKNPTKQGFVFEGWIDKDNVLRNQVTINKGTTGNLTFTASFKEGTSTPYTVIHKYRNLDGSFKTEVQEGTGVTNSTITISVRPKTGFVNPTEQQLLIKPSGDSSLEYVYEREEYTFEVNSDVETTFTNPSYPYETEITVTAKSKLGHDFVKWSNNKTDNPLTFKITGDTTLTPIYEVQNYEVTFKPQNGESDITRNRNYDTELGTLPEVSRTGYTFNGWYTEPTGGVEITATTKVTGVVTYYAHWTIENYEVTFNPQSGESNTIINRDYNTELGTLPEVNRLHYTFDGWYTEPTGGVKITSATKVTGVVTYYAHWTIENYEVTFNPQNGESAIVITRNYDEKLGELPEVSKTGHTFNGWYTESTGGVEITSATKVTGKATYYAQWTIENYQITLHPRNGEDPTIIYRNYDEELGTLPEVSKIGTDLIGWFTTPMGGEQVTATTKITGSATYYAIWDTKPLICKKAFVKHEQTCELTDANKGCRKSGYALNSTVEYGNIPSSTPTAGDIYNCDVNGDRVFDDATERFYYIGTNGTRAVFIYSTNVTNGATNHELIYPYSEIYDHLPNSVQWLGTEIFDNKRSRLITLSEINAICPNGDLSNCNYLLENTAYTTSDKTRGRSALWIDGGDHRYRGDTNNITTADSSNTSGIRPVIEVSLDQIENSYVIEFDGQGGTVSKQYLSVAKGESIKTLPTVEHPNRIFEGWYTEPTGGEKVTENTIPTQDTKYYAQYLTTISDATITNETISLFVDSQEMINITNAADIDEEYSFTSGDSTIAKVAIDGLVTGVAIGQTNITITGLSSGETRVIAVHVVADDTTYTVTFNSNGGPNVAAMIVTPNSEIGTLPVPEEYPGYTFDKWYTNNTFTTAVTPSTVIVEDVEFIANWIDNNAVARIGNTYYNSIDSALSSISNKNIETTIVLIKDVQEAVVLNDGYNLVLDLGGYTLTNSGTAAVVENYDKLTLKNGTIRNATGAGAINNKPNATMIVDSLEVYATGKRQALYNEGKLTIKGDTILSNTTTERAALQNQSTGNITLLSATITASGLSGINNSGALTIGNKDGIIDNTKISIQGKTYGVDSSTNFSFYDGIIEGKAAAISNTSKVTDIDYNSSLTIIDPSDSSTEYGSAYLVGGTNYTITFMINDGTSNAVVEVVEQGSSLNSLPNPYYEGYMLENWYDDANGGNVVTAPIEPDSNKVYYARWIKTVELADVTPTSIGLKPGETEQVTVTPDLELEDYTFNSSDDSIITVNNTGVVTAIAYGEAKVLIKGVRSNKTKEISVTVSETGLNIVSYDPTSSAIKTYYSRIDSWKNDEATFREEMLQNFNNNDCKCTENTCTGGTVLCDKPVGYDTGTNGKVNVYTYDLANEQVGDLVKYSRSNNGVITNLIPGEVYYWELESDNTVNGYIKFTSNRRFIDAGGVRNVRDLGGLEVDVDNDGITDGTLNYGILYRGEKVGSAVDNQKALQAFDIDEEVDLRASSERANNELSIGTFKLIEMKHYQIDRANYPSYYTMDRNAVKEVMQDVVAGNSIYFHCRIGTDRTGTLAFILEGLLNVKEEQKLEDYELSFFYGLVNRHRFYATDPNSSVSKTEKFVYMYDKIPNNQKIYEWYMDGTDDEEADKTLINQFRSVMIKGN